MKGKILKTMVKMMDKPSQEETIAKAIEKEMDKNKEMNLMKKAFSTKYGLNGDIRIRPVVEEGTFNTKGWMVLVEDKKITEQEGYSDVYNYLMEGSLSKDEKTITNYIEDLKKAVRM